MVLKDEQVPLCLIENITASYFLQINKKWCKLNVEKLNMVSNNMPPKTYKTQGLVFSLIFPLPCYIPQPEGV